MTIETEVAALTTATTSLLSAVNVSKATLDQKVLEATDEAGNAAASAVLATTNGVAQVASAAIQVALALGHKNAALDQVNLAQAARDAAQSYASLAQATNPDSPIRINPRKIAANFTVASAYNASSTGPITISPGVTVTVQDNATWAIH